MPITVCPWRCFPALPGLCCEWSSVSYFAPTFGLSVAPWAFTCVIRPLESICFRWGQLLYSFLDPFFLLDSSHGVLGSPHLESVPVSWVTSRCWEDPPDSFPLLVCLSVLFHLDSALSPSGLQGPFHLPSLYVSRHMSCHGLELPAGTLDRAAQSIPLRVLCLRPLVAWLCFLTSPVSRDVPDALDHWTLSVWLEVDFLVRLSLCPCLFWLCGS